MWLPSGPGYSPPLPPASLPSRARLRLTCVTREGNLAGGKDKMEDPSYIERLARHCAILIAWEDTALAVDEDRLMLAVVFMQAHCVMVTNELREKQETEKGDR